MLKILRKLRRAILRLAEPAQRLAAPAVQTRAKNRWKEPLHGVEVGA